MKDRTLIVLAVLFLLLTVGTGVNTSLEAGNRFMGKPMAPDLKHAYNQQAPIVLDKVKELREAGKQRTERVYSEYPIFVKEFNQVTSRVGRQIKDKTEPLRKRVLDTVGNLKARTVNK